MSKCPCGANENYGSCCELYIKGKDKPATAEALMRARYSAYAKGEIGYLRDTLVPSDRETFDEESTTAWSKKSKWLSLDVLSKKGGTETDHEGEVEFIAKFEFEGEKAEHRERAKFQRIGGDWFFVEGKVRRGDPIVREVKIGRNDPCSCGSGKKFKKCCGK